MTTVDLTTVPEFKAPYIKQQELVIRCIGIERKDSKKGNDMLEIKQEIASPESITVDGKTVKIAGLQCSDWIVLAESGFNKLGQFMGACKLPTTISVDGGRAVLPATLPTDFLGKAYKVTLYTQARNMVDTVTNEPILDAEGKPEVSYNYRVKKYIAAEDSLTVPASTIPY